MFRFDRKSVPPILVVAGWLLAACAPAAAQPTVAPGTTASTDAAPAPRGGVEGTILIDGSSTVAPITSAVAEEYQKVNPDVRVPVGISGTGGGFKKFCAGETDISNASRPIKESEAELCAQQGIEYIELPIAFDGLAVMVNPANEFVACLTVEELKRMWEPAAEGVVMSWAQIREGFPDQPLALYGPGTDSGTYDYFTQAIAGEEGASRGDFFPSEDDNVLVQGIAGDADATGFFGLAYYQENREVLKLVGVDGGNGCIEPNAQTVADGTYQPLSRPIFVYVNRERLDARDEIRGFVEFYLQQAGALSADVGYIPLTESLYDLARQRVERRQSGSIFAGLGSTVGVSLEDLLAQE